MYLPVVPCLPRLLFCFLILSDKTEPGFKYRIKCHIDDISSEASFSGHLFKVYAGFSNVFDTSFTNLIYMYIFEFYNILRSKHAGKEKVTACFPGSLSRCLTLSTHSNCFLLFGESSSVAFNDARKD